MNSLLVIILGLAVTPAVAHTFSLRAGQPEGHPPPAPEGEPPELESDGAYISKDAACQACKFYATGSCAMFKTCVCHATNAFFGIAGLPEPSDKDNWHATSLDAYAPSDSGSG